MSTKFAIVLLFILPIVVLIPPQILTAQQTLNCGVESGNFLKKRGFPPQKQLSADRTVNDFCIKIKAYVTPAAVTQIGAANVTSAINSAINTANTRWSKTNNPTLDDNISYSLQTPIVQWSSIPFTWDSSDPTTTLNNFGLWYVDQGFPARVIGIVFAANTELPTVVGIADWGGNNPVDCDFLPDYIFGDIFVRIGNSVVLAHELGHLWGCDHDANSPCYIMSSNGCGSVFSANSVNVINQSATNLETGCFSEVSCLSLPMELTSFDAAIDGMANRVTWQVASAQGIDRFDIERSVDGGYFEKMGSVNRPSEAFPARFEWFDEYPPARSFYRLRSVDFSGRGELGPVRSLIREQQVFSGAQVVSNGIFPIEIERTAGGAANLSLFDISGRLVRQADGLEGHIELPAGDLPNGVFIAIIRYGDGRVTHLRFQKIG